MKELAKHAASWLSSARRRKLIVALEEAIRRDPTSVAADAFVTRHHFAPGQYAREIELPEGMCVVGKIHKHAHINIVSRGAVLVYTEHDGLQEIVAPATFVSKPATKRAVLALEDTVWTTVHVTQETELEAIERDIIAPAYTALEEQQA